MAYLIILLVGYATYLIFRFVHFKRSISDIILISKSTIHTIRSNQADEVKQKLLLQLSAKQFRLSLLILFQTFVLCVPSFLFFWFYQDFIKDTFFLIVSSLLSLLTFLIGYFIKRNEK